MMKFRVRRIVPPGGWYFYEVPGTGAVLRTPSLSTLLTAIETHMRDNGIDIPENLPELVEDYICRNVPPGFCFGDPEGRPIARTVTLSDIRSKTMAAFLGARGIVDQGTARIRLDTCIKCVHNDRRMCPSCVGLTSWARDLVKTKCPRDEWLGVCSVDAVALPAKVHFRNVSGNAGYPEGCWAAKGE